MTRTNTPVTTQQFFIGDLCVIKNEITALEGRPSKGSEDAYLFLHGFPAATGEKNQDLALEATKKTGVSSYVLHYRGLGKSHGKFSFTESVVDAINVAQTIITDHKVSKLTLVGHSWGGLVAMNVFKSISVPHRHNIILLAPFVHFPEDDSIRNWLNQIEKSGSVHFKIQTPGWAAKDFYDTKILYDPLSEIHKIKEANKILIFMSNQDDEVPNSSTYELLKLLEPVATLKVLDTNHSFSANREWVINAILESL